MRILVTGTSRGIGLELARTFCERGWTVTGCSRAAASFTHANYTHHALDVGDERAVAAMVRGAVRAHGGLDAVLNNAGIASMNPVLLTPLSVAESILRTNFIGTFLVSREAAKAMARAKQGRIVNFTTVAAPLRLEGEALYAASKAAVENLTRILARELAPLNITVNAVGPTPVPTDLIRGVPKDALERLLARQAIPRLGTVADVLNVVDFFLRPESSFVTGQVVYLGGVG